MRLGGEARKGFRLTLALGPWGWRLLWRWASGGRVAGLHPLEHEAQPHQGDQHQLVEKERRYHGKTPSDKCCNEGILPGFQTVGISRMLEVQDRCAKHCRIRRRALSCGAISPLRMRSSISYARIKHCASPCRNQRRGANGSNELRRWQQSSQTISGVSKNSFRIASLLPRTRTSFTA